MGETRINLKHLLEDIRDSYPFSIEEAIITELIANALDSGASTISFHVRPKEAAFIIIDNGNGMTPAEFEVYHDIAASTKIRGKGIGFAGIGAKLALLIADNVVTETRKDLSYIATRWRMVSPTRAAWDYIEPPGFIANIPHGTAVWISVRERVSSLLNQDFVERVIQTHFHPILDSGFAKILRVLYKNGVYFTVNGFPVRAPSYTSRSEPRYFPIMMGRRRSPIGIGFICKSDDILDESERGIAVSTYGKVIKRGWDWIGLSPRNPMQVFGIVEIPAFSEILTTNKADFLRDASSLQKYYRYRKAIQEAIEPILQQLGEVSAPRERPEESLRPIEKEIERVLSDLSPDFPELIPLLGRRSASTIGPVPDPQSPPTASPQPATGKVDRTTGTQDNTRQDDNTRTSPEKSARDRLLEWSDTPLEGAREHQVRRRRPGIMIGFEDSPERDELGWIVEDTIWINRAHPAYQRVTSMGKAAEAYHLVLAVSWVLSAYLDSDKSPQMFISQFLSKWGRVA